MTARSLSEYLAGSPISLNKGAEFIEPNRLVEDSEEYIHWLSFTIGQGSVISSRSEPDNRAPCMDCCVLGWNEEHRHLLQARQALLLLTKRGF